MEYEEFVRDRELLPAIAFLFRYISFEKEVHPRSESVLRYMTNNGLNTELYGYTLPNMRSSYKALCKYGNVNPFVDQRSWEFANICCHQEFDPYINDCQLSSRQFVIEQMAKDTSPGGLWPFIQKREFFASPEVNPILDEYEDSMASDEPLMLLKKVSSKREVRPRTKLDQDPPSIRGFVADDICAVILSGQFSLDFNNKLYSSNCKHSSAVGRSKFMGGFHVMACMISIFESLFSLDFRSYDTAQFFQLMLCQAMYRWDRFSDKVKKDIRNWKMFLNMTLGEIISFMWAEDGNIFLKLFGTISGSGNTLPNNTMNTFRLYCYVFAYLWFEEHYNVVTSIDILERSKSSLPFGSDAHILNQERLDQMREKLLSYNYFKSVCQFLVTGDDNTLGISDKIISWFNYPNMARVFFMLGIQCTSEFPTPRFLSDVTFVSQNWVKIPGISIWLPSPNKDKVLGSLLNGCKSKDVRWSLLRAFALRIDCWANLECRFLIDGYISFVRREYGDFLCGDVDVPGVQGLKIPMKDINSVCLTEDQLYSLYTGFESNVSIPRNIINLLCLIEGAVDVS